MQKKTSFTELFYLTLLISALRPPENGLYRRGGDRGILSGSSDTLGPILAEDICFNGGDRYFDSYGSFPNLKSVRLTHETNQVLDYINSLGRYSEHTPFSSSLFAYPMSRGHSDYATDLSPLIEDDIPISETPTSSNPNDDLLSNDQLLSDFNDLNFNAFDDPYLGLDLFNLTNDSLLNDDAVPFDNNTASEFTTTTLNNEDLEEADSADDIFVQALNVDELLTDSSVMFPIIDSNDGDVNDLFGELELLLSNETDGYGQEWQSTPFYTAIPNGEHGEFPLFDSSITTNTSARPLESCTIFDIPQAQMQTDSSGSFAASNGSNFGSVLYSSLTALSNPTNEHLNSVELPASQSLVYNNSDISDTAYMSNVSNLSVNNVSTPDCFYNGYLPEEVSIPESANQPQVSASSNGSQSYHHGNSYPQQPETFYTSTPVKNSNHFSATASEDCFDKSSDSAVSSMSSDRVHSFSDNDWVETSSESSYNGDYTNNENKCGNSVPQKKYRLFGKNKSAENFKNTSQDYYVDYGQTGYSAYPSSCTANSNENYETQMNNYYATSVAHNHTYAQPIEVTPLTSMSANIISNSWQSTTETTENLPSIKKEDETIRSLKSTTNKKLTNSNINELLKKDPHLNRDEKRARALKIPISTEDIINLPIDEFNERLAKYELTEIQLSLIRDIRRRGKNKVAAQNCRKRKLDQIMGLQSEVDTMFSQKSSLEAQYNKLIMMREMARDKYTKLYQFVVEASSSRQPFFELTSASPPVFPDRDSTQEVQLSQGSGNSFALTANISSSVPVSATSNEFNKHE